MLKLELCPSPRKKGTNHIKKENLAKETHEPAKK